MSMERRATPRFSFIASAEILEPNTGVCLKAHVNDISVSGCYLDTMQSLHDGTDVWLKIFNDGASFEAQATVAYSQLHMGMGIKFEKVDADSFAVLQNWLPATVPA